MTATERFDRDLTAWLQETAVPMGADDIDDILRRTAGQRQRPRWTFLERWIPMSETTLGRPVGGALRWRPVLMAGLLLLALAAIVAVGIGSRPAVPEPFGLASNGLMAFGRGGDIVVMDPATGVERVLVGGTGFDAYPLYSHDGTKIAFERTTGGRLTLMVADVAGGEPIAVSGPTDGIYGLQWSPDDRYLAFSNGELIVAAADGSDARSLPLGDIRSEGFPMWRPAGEDQILFLGGYAGGSASYIIDQDGTGLHQLTRTDGSAVKDGAAQWLPDGRILTRRGESNVTLRLHLMTLDESGTVTKDEAVGPELIPGAVGYHLSPDGTRSVGAIAHPGEPGWRIGVIPLDGTGDVVETGPFFSAEVGVGWSPDGQSIVVTDAAHDTVWLLDAAGGPERRLRGLDAATDPPAWQRLAP
jgi:dipeptidyl aminopeptidase/acylaminoacyl peptidase